jgi:Protein of unknown function (DUF3179)
MAALAARLVLVGAVAASPVAAPAGGATAEVPDVRLFFEAASRDGAVAEAALERLGASWRDGYAGPLIDLARFLPAPRQAAAAGPDPAPGLPGVNGGEGGRGFGPSGADSAGFATDPLPRGPVDPRVRIRERLVRFLEERTGQGFGHDLRRWRRWLWNRDYDPHPDYALFKAALYSRIDERMASFFPPGAKERIRLDEVDWGGVAPDGIPPLVSPRHVPAREAGYLKDKNVVFGVYLNGEARAYPKRILAWHELARDTLGGVDLTIVYCTLCGTVIPYGSQAGGKRWTLGTSGLLYRSNKLMFDQETLSLWSTVEGRPVLGPLAGEDLVLPAYPVVTTRWREWVAAHPDTTVLSLDTGYDRDYDEGAAYREYFATDRLMFEVPRTDDRLKNKDEVLALLLAPAGHPEGERRALAIAEKLLRKDRVRHLSFAGHDLVVVTSRDGAHRVYAGGIRFIEQDGAGRVRDDRGRLWIVTEDALVPEPGGPGPQPRVPARRAFWFGWSAQFPETELVR